jgi:predicted O-methyltransferase YrrM
MTSRDTTGLLALSDEGVSRPLEERLFAFAWGAIQWPWLLRSLHGGRKVEKRALLERLELPAHALPNLGSWKADTIFLGHIVDAVERLQPREVVELGCGASSLVIAKALERNGGGRLISYDQNAQFTAATRGWLAGHGLAGEIRHAPLQPDPSPWSSIWYDLSHIPSEIDLLVIDGPPWAINPLIRGRAEILFQRLRPGGMVLLDDAARPGERLVTRKWRKNWPDIDFRFDSAGAKGTLIGTKGASTQS